MMTDKSYTVTFVRKGTFQEEIYHYNNLYLAKEHFRDFYNQESSDMYALISISEYCWSTGEKIILGLLSFYEFSHGSKIKKIGEIGLLVEKQSLKYMISMEIALYTEK